MDKNPSLKIYGVLGFPAKHSLSPLMQTAAFRALGIEAEYRIFETPPEKFDDFMRGLFESGLSGLNVTVPYKEKVLKYLNWQSPETEFAGACNTIVIKPTGLDGWNTDGIGFHLHLTRDLKFELKDKKIVILGAGGAAKAITCHLAKHAVASLQIYDLDLEKGAKLAEKISKEFSRCKASSVSSIESLEIKNADLLINATPIGMKDSDPLLINENMLHKGLFVYDVIYNPPETKLLQCARKAGAETSNGLGMLLYQGARSFELWTAHDAPVEAMRKALEEGVKNL